MLDLLELNVEFAFKKGVSLASQILQVLCLLLMYPGMNLNGGLDYDCRELSLRASNLCLVYTYGDIQVTLVHLVHFYIWFDEIRDFPICAS